MSVATAPQTNVYRPYGAAVKIMHCKDREVLLDGPAGTGKSIAWLTKMYICCEGCPGMRGQLLRKYRASLTDSALVTWEEKVLPPGHPALRGPKREQRHIYRFPNGSTVTVSGLDDADKQKSSEYDFVYIQEATEIEEDDLTPVVRGMRYGVMPFQQIGMDCNPAEDTHWLKKRFERGQTTRFASVHEDNPELYDHERGEWTPRGIEYLAELDAIPSRVDRLRLRHGIWAGAEGRVYDGWDALAHVTKPFPIPDTWPRYMGLDFGGTNTAALFYALNPDTDQLVLYREYLAGGRTAGQHVPFLLADESMTPFTVGGAKAEGQWRLEFKAAGLHVVEPKIKDVALGISRVNGQHKKNGIVVFDTCTGYIEQKSSYRYLADAADPDAIERKRHFHYMDSERYLVGYLRPESDVRRGGPPVYAKLKRL